MLLEWLVIKVHNSFTIIASKLTNRTNTITFSYFIAITSFTIKQ